MAVKILTAAVVISCFTPISLCQRYLGEIDIAISAFATVFVDEDAVDARDRYSILVSTFNPIPFTRDTSYMIPRIGYHLEDVSSADVVELYDQFLFPREISQIPRDVFGFDAIAQPEGFLTPSKNDGTINLIRVDDYQPTLIHDPLSSRNDEWFYHRVLWKDMDGDGKKDALTCRADFDFGDVDSQLLWLKHPEEPFVDDWPVNIISSDICDTFAILAELSGEEVLFTVGYFTQSLVVHWSNHPDGSWANPNDIEVRVIDTGHQFFDLSIADLNDDGNRDLLVTLNAETDGSLVAYEIPDDFRHGEYVQHVLASGFDARSGVGGAGAPGASTAFYPDDRPNSKPDIVLSGDDDGRAYMLRPRSENPNDWDYELSTFLDEGPGQIVGQIAVADVDDDGQTEFFVPSYMNGKLYVYTYEG